MGEPIKIGKIICRVQTNITCEFKTFLVDPDILMSYADTSSNPHSINKYAISNGFYNVLIGDTCYADILLS